MLVIEMKTMYFNGNIITMTDANVEAFVVEDGKILSMGSKEDCISEDMECIDLQGRTLMPSFLDGHSHFSGVAMSFLQVDLSKCTCVKDVLDAIRMYIQENPEKEFITGQGYDHLSLKEKRHVTRQELDGVCAEKSIVLQHQSGHNGVLNTKALAYLKIDENTKVEGGRIDFENGFLEENAFIENVKKFPMADLKDLKQAFKKAQEYYASFGITTIQEGMMVDELYDIYQMLIHEDVLYLDVIGYAGFEAKKFIADMDAYTDDQHHFRIGGYKMFLDGSPQNKTAWTINPYTDGSHGYPTMNDEQIENCLKQAIQQNKQILAHCNGDMASRHYIDVYRKCKKQDIRPVIIHAQMLRNDQIQEAKELSMIASFFAAHVHYFGDIHRQNMGEERAKGISPLHSALNAGLAFTLHQDSPVLPPNVLETIDIAMHRVTKSGFELGKEECISSLDALKAVTINTAYQYHEEKIKGTLEVGKLADLVILDQDPRIFDCSKIQVLATIKEGKVIYKKSTI